MKSNSDRFHIVAIGASAGGLEALNEFFSHVPLDSGIGYVVVQHLSPDYESLMVELLSKKTKLPVGQAKDGIRIKPDHIYLIPPNRNMTISDHCLQLTERKKSELRLNLPIDLFFRSLAQDVGEDAIVVVLSGTGSDGTSGIRAVKEEGGMVVAQDESARFDGMPRSAIATQLVDIVLPPSKMPEAIINYVQYPGLGMSGDGGANDGANDEETNRYEDTFEKIFALIYDQTTVDFSLYKPSTMIRRIERRMSVNQIADLPNYLVFLRQSSAEVQILFKELLIGVTKFLRDREAFDLLRDEVIPQILERKTVKDTVRVWVAGCSTGEEAYTLAFLFSEQMEKNNQRLNVKIFATDIDREALDTASRGVYPQNIAIDVDDIYLQKYFIKKGDSYEVIPRVRELVIFAQQNIVKDPPFSKTDLVTCRNVLIYFQPVLQKRAIDNFEFALLPDGFLFLGSSETVSERDHFSVFDSKLKIYQKTDYGSRAPTRAVGEMPNYEPARPKTVFWKPTIRQNVKQTEHLFKQLVDQLLPPCVIVNSDLDLLHAFGDLNQYLSTPTGYNISLNLVDMIHSDLSIAVGTAVHKAFKDNKEILYTNLVMGDVEPKTRLRLLARPLASIAEHTDRVLLIFEEQVVDEGVEQSLVERQKFDLSESASQRIVDLEQELQYTRETLQATIEELETANEELQATNEELLAANEELQSTNEELQSVNEELITVNAEFQVHIQELVELNDDLNNVFSITNAGTIFLDEFLNIRRFTPAAQANINLMTQDISRPFSHISHGLVNVQPLEIIKTVLDSLVSDEREVQNSEGEWFLMRTVPYRTAQNAIRGVVVTFVDISQIKRTQQRLIEREKMVQALSEQNLELEEQLKPLEILLIEDDLSLTNLMKKSHFKELMIRYNLLAVSTGELAIDYLMQSKNSDEEYPVPDLIVTDLNLPDMRGQDLIAEIKGMAHLKDVAIIVMTGMEPKVILPEIVQSDSNAFLHKPFNPVDFRRAVRSVFSSYDFVVVKKGV